MPKLKVAKIEVARTEICQNWKLPELSKLKIAMLLNCQDWKLPKLKIAKVKNCQYWKLRIVKNWKLTSCQNWNMPKLKIAELLNCQFVSLRSWSEVLSFLFLIKVSIFLSLFQTNSVKLVICQKMAMFEQVNDQLLVDSK